MLIYNNLLPIIITNKKLHLQLNQKVLLKFNIDFTRYTQLENESLMLNIVTPIDSYLKTHN